MAGNNHTFMVEFVLQGFTENPQLQDTCFTLFFLLYVMALAGNSVILMAIYLNPALHIPMYYFLTNLAILDILCTSTALPKLLENLMGMGFTISYGGCMTQMFFLTWFLGAELLLLTVMAYDRYVAICQPLHYHTLMSRPLCALLVGSVWMLSGINSSVQTGLMTRLTFCTSNQIHHFLCEVPTLLLLACSPTYVNNIMIVIAHFYLGVVNFLFTMASYGFIIASILRIHSSESKRRAFSTCSSHLLVVCMYYTTVVYTYILPVSGFSMDIKVLSVFYTALSPVLNPLIYTLRNKDVKVALGKVFPTFDK